MNRATIPDRLVEETPMRKGEKVIHRFRTEWGIGDVQDILQDGTIIVSWENPVGSKDRFWSLHHQDNLDPIECEGHPAGPLDPMGSTVYCDGTCRK